MSESTSDDETAGLFVVREVREALSGDVDAWTRSDGRLDLRSQEAARTLASRLDGTAGSGGRWSPADLYAAAVFDAAVRSLLGASGVASRAVVESAEASVGAESLDALLESFRESFLPEDDPTRGRAGRAEETVTIDLVAVRLLNVNPAADPLSGIVSDEYLEPTEAYDAVVRATRGGEDEPGGGAGNVAEALFELVDSGPDDWVGQFETMGERWGDRLPAAVVERLARATDVVREHQRAAGRGGPPPVEPPELESLEGVADYSDDRDWMEELVVVAKNALVWLEQLDRRYAASVQTLADVPEEALERLSDFGIDCLWLIGIWERSPASRRIKRLSGRPDAAASAYAIRGYRISERLGGQEAKEVLEERAAEHGVRLAADMVPNHTGLDADWVVDRPEWFLSVDEPPFESYSFEGPDLSDDDSVELRIEDGYYDQTDAAVVFERRDRSTGETEYVYHGNDGTETPWNDTAQLDFLREEVRDAVVETIVEVAREFSVLRFDAAMVLAREQIRRLWHPRPGEGGAIPSRSEKGVSEEEFDRRMPDEFWRRVVEEVEQRAPGTLLVAEAFWKMEGYFVRSLGMHRVYNSAFMDMLRDEENGEFQDLVAETLRHDPRTLKRYVNYLNNPDEETALEQFGDGDQYFGACVVMATLPGLPMFGHGQIEGLSEKYGMDFDAPLIDESPDPGMVERHRREIAPLLEQRGRFAGVEHFRWFRPRDGGGQVVDDVFAYANGAGIETSVVVYHNHFGDARVFVDESVRRRARSNDQLETSEMSEVLPVDVDGAGFLVFEDALRDESYLRPLAEVRQRGLAVALGPYEARVFESFRRVCRRSDGRLQALLDRIGLEGVASLEDELHAVRLEPVRRAFRALVGPDIVDRLVDVRESSAPSGRVRERAERLVEATDELMGVDGGGVVAETIDRVETLGRGVPSTTLEEASPMARKAAVARQLIGPFVERLAEEGDSRARRVLERLRLVGVAEEALAASEPPASSGVWQLTTVLLGAPVWGREDALDAVEVVDWILGDDEASAHVGTGAEETSGFDVAAATRLVEALGVGGVVESASAGHPDSDPDRVREVFARVVEAAEASGGDTDDWRSELR